MPRIAIFPLYLPQYFKAMQSTATYGYPNCIDLCSVMLNHSFFRYKPDWIKNLDRSTGLGSDRITQ